jgi:hypothetical protein
MERTGVPAEGAAVVKSRRLTDRTAPRLVGIGGRCGAAFLGNQATFKATGD